MCTTLYVRFYGWFFELLPMQSVLSTVGVLDITEMTDQHWKAGLLLSCVVGCCKAIATEHSQSCMQKLWSAQVVMSLYGMLECTIGTGF